MSNTAKTNPVKKEDKTLEDPMLNLEQESDSADGYFDEDLDTNLDLDLSFLDEDEDDKE